MLATLCASLTLIPLGTMPPPVVIRPQLKSGDKWEWKVKQTFTFLPEVDDEVIVAYLSKFQFSATVNNRNLATISRSYWVEKIWQDGQPVPMPPAGKPIVHRYPLTAYGLPMADVDKWLDKNEFRLERLLWFGGSHEALDIGDSWQVTIPEDLDRMAGAKLTYAYVGNETVSGRSARKVSVKFVEQRSFQPMRAQGNLWVDASVGIPLKMRLQVDRAPIIGSDGKVGRLEVEVDLASENFQPR